MLYIIGASQQAIAAYAKEQGIARRDYKAVTGPNDLGDAKGRFNRLAISPTATHLPNYGKIIETARKNGFDL